MERHIVGSTPQNNDEAAVLTAEKAVEKNDAQPETKPDDANAYAHMFAEWDLLPPQMVIRRVRRK